MGILESVHEPADISGLSQEELRELSGEIRSFLIEKVCHSGGHLGPNLGVVELTIALHRVFTSPRDRILWDTGHQAYVHKILTGRQLQFSQLRQRDGLSGYPSRAESEHDIIENSHASTVLSYADGLAKGYQLRGVTDRAVVAIVGDGALTGGMAWEALNNISANDRPIIIVVNDNGRSYAPTIGGLAHHLATLRTSRGYERFLDWGKRLLAPVPVVYETLHGLKKGVKDMIAPQGMFEDLGFKYIGPIDGHDIAEMEFALRRAANFGGPVIVHCLTRKGNGYSHAENDELDCFHSVRAMDARTGQPLSAVSPSWTSVFSAEMLRIGEERTDVVAITAAMLEPTGLVGFRQRFPHRVFDVGIAEQHAVTSGLRIAAPRDAPTLREELREALLVSDAPSVIRFPKGSAPPDITAVDRYGSVDILRRDRPEDVLLVSAGPMAGLCLEAAARLADQGIGATVIDPRWLSPLSPAIPQLASRYRLVGTVEDNVRVGGFGAMVALGLRDALIDTPVVNFGLPKRFLAQGKRSEVLADCGLTAAQVARALAEQMAKLARPRLDGDNLATFKEAAV